MYFKKRNNTSLNKDIATIREYLSRVGDLTTKYWTNSPRGWTTT